jgi:quercetin 2,3-dioxygenase
MLTLRSAQERGHAQHGWLDSYHTFSFADYYDPAHMGVSVLRVINEDRVQPGKGFPPHSHRDMEILTYVLKGALAHKDSLGNGSVIHPGDVQRMSAGTGITHSEYNPSSNDLLHLLQIWLLPNRTRLSPSYEQRTFPEAATRGQLRLVASPDGRDGSVTIHQDAFVYATTLRPGDTVTHKLAPNRTGYLHVARGDLTLNTQTLRSGDGVAIIDGESLTFVTESTAEALLFDLP